MSESTKIFAERKLLVIARILEVKDVEVLDEMESIFERAKHEQYSLQKNFKQFAGLMSDTEVDEMQRIIEEGCGMTSINK